MKLERKWAMPNKYTFTIKPIMELINSYCNGGKGWVDPMSGFNSPAEITNDGNPDSPAKFHKDALEFLKEIDTASVNGVIFDPPYSYEKAKRLYKVKYPDTQVFFNYIRRCKRNVVGLLSLVGMLYYVVGIVMVLEIKMVSNLLNCYLCHMVGRQEILLLLLKRKLIGD